MSLVRPEIPSSPDCLLSSASTSESVMPSLAARNSTSDGSMSPDRVPMMSPSSGVKPIEVLKEAPALMAHAEQPLPRCSVMMFTRSLGRSRSRR